MMKATWLTAFHGKGNIAIPDQKVSFAEYKFFIYGMSMVSSRDILTKHSSVATKDFEYFKRLREVNEKHTCVFFCCWKPVTCMLTFEHT